MHTYWREFTYLAVAHLLAVASPGPDFAMVLRQSLAHDRRVAVWTSIGIGSGILVHVAYSLLGIGLILKSSALAFSILKYAGAAYLAWMGVQALRSRPRPRAASTVGPTAPAAGGTVAEARMQTGGGGEPATTGPRAAAPSARAAWTTGFLTNALNPKATLFFVALFPLVVSPLTPKLVQAGYGLWMAVTTAIWFSLVACLFTRADVQRRFLRHGHWVDRALGGVLIAFAVKLAFATLV